MFAVKAQVVKASVYHLKKKTEAGELFSHHSHCSLFSALLFPNDDDSELGHHRRQPPTPAGINGLV